MWQAHKLISPTVADGWYRFAEFRIVNLPDSIMSVSCVVLRCFSSSRLRHFVSGVKLSQVLCFFTGVLGRAELLL